MSNQSNQESRDGRVILAWIILALQIIGLLWLLLFARDRLAAFSGQARTAEVAQATTVPTAVAEEATAAMTEEDSAAQAVDDAATEGAAEAATRAIIDAAATAEAASPTAEPTAQPSADAANVLPPEEVTIDPALVAPEWLATLVEGAAPNGEPAEGAAVVIPPHLLLTFVDPNTPDADPAAPDAIDLNRPQLRIIPVAALLAMLQQSGDTASQQALEELLALLEARPAAEEASVPVPPVLGQAAQNFVARPAYGRFGGGEGIGYVTNITGEDVLPVTNESGLNYVYQGLTTDGRHYVFLAWPMDADFLPATATDAIYETEILASDPTGYYTALRDQVNQAADQQMNPTPTLLSHVLSTLSISGAAVASDEGAPVAGSAAEAVGFQWNWTNRTDAGGIATPVEAPQNYTLVLWPDGSYNIKAYCNVGGGAFTYDDEGMIRFQPGPLSMALCPSGSRDTEFVQGLLAARALGFDESGDMILELEDGSRLTLANVGEAEVADVAAAEDQPNAADSGLTGLVLQWPGVTGGAETIAPANPENYTITFLPDGTFTIEADCNVGGGAYVFGDDGALQLGPIRLTRAQCAAGSLDNEFVTFLERVSSATVGDDGSVTLTTADGGSATFVNIGPVADSGAASEPTGAAVDNATAAQENGLLGVVWQWSGLTLADGTAALVDDPATYTLTLLDDGTYAFRADCNNGAGGYTLDRTTLALLPGAMTLAACDADSRSDEFAGYLGQVSSYAFDGDDLVLTLADGETLTFINGGPFVAEAVPDETTAADDPLANSTWFWAHFRDAKQDYNVSGDYFITFNADGSVGVTADCNVGIGTYRTDGDTLTISLGPSTLVACADGSLSSSFLDYLSQAGAFAIDDDGTLVIELMADGGTMALVPAP